MHWIDGAGADSELSLSEVKRAVLKETLTPLGLVERVRAEAARHHPETPTRPLDAIASGGCSVGKDPRYWVAGTNVRLLSVHVGSTSLTTVTPWRGDSL